MPRGGKRIGAGSKPKWNSGKTKVVRVPESIADQVIEYAHGLDTNQALLTLAESKVVGYDGVTESKTIDLSGMSIASVSGKACVFLQDLALAGYEIKPKKLADKIVSELYKRQLSQGI